VPGRGTNDKISGVAGGTGPYIHNLAFKSYYFYQGFYRSLHGSGISLADSIAASVERLRAVLRLG